MSRVLSQLVRYVINSTRVRLQIALDLGGITTNLRVENLIGMKNVCKNIFTVILKVRNITVFWKMCQLLLLIKLMALIPRKGRLLDAFA